MEVFDSRAPKIPGILVRRRRVCRDCGFGGEKGRGKGQFRTVEIEEKEYFRLKRIEEDLAQIVRSFRGKKR